MRPMTSRTSIPTGFHDFQARNKAVRDIPRTTLSLSRLFVRWTTHALLHVRSGSPCVDSLLIGCLCGFENLAQTHSHQWGAELRWQLKFTMAGHRATTSAIGGESRPEIDCEKIARSVLVDVGRSLLSTAHGQLSSSRPCRCNKAKATCCNRVQHMLDPRARFASRIIECLGEELMVPVEVCPGSQRPT